jgi:LysM domain
MQYDTSYTSLLNGPDGTGIPAIPRAPLAFARSAPLFAQALAAAKQQPNGQLGVDINAVPLASKMTESNLATSNSSAGSTSANPWLVSVRSGNTLTSIVREQMAQQGVNVNANEATRLAQDVAKSNNISNPNLIHPGQQLKLDVLRPVIYQTLASNRAVAASQAFVASQALLATNNQKISTSGTAATQLALRQQSTDSVVLEKTIDRAIAKGFIPAQDKQAVIDKITQLSIQHRFSPDDFARLTLMESDGMNPKATNNRCHGIIQFCDGPDRGAASAGHAANPKAILGYSVLQQLDLVDKYFDETGLKNYGPVGLDDLYLTVLTPAARNETRPNAALSIPGPQAAYLHVNKDTRAPITRNSILAGLHQNANERLGVEPAQVRLRMPPHGLSAYAAQARATEDH